MAEAGTQNGMDPKIVRDLIGRIENLQDQIVTEHMAYMQKVGSIKEDIGEIYDEGKSKGIPKKALRLNVKRRELEGKIEDLRADLDGDDVDQYDLVRHALGELADTEIGKAAMARAADKAKTDGNIEKLGRGPIDPDKDDKLRDLRPRNLREGGSDAADKKPH